ncbi:hypothetical protein ONS96_003126 [Cadophora gregata f. sp. sojae]|nr:hypothetical protein ONS96_003126 [Cadophora gregata f. sp. sojae]
MEISVCSLAEKQESYQEAAIRKLYDSLKAELSKSYTAVRDAYTVSSPGEPDRVPNMLADLFEKVSDPARLHRMAAFGAERQYLNEVHEQYFKDQDGISSNVQHVAAFSSKLARRKDLCGVCLHVAKQISSILLLFNNGLDWKSYVNEYWPPRPMPSDMTREQYIVGNRFIPPEDINPGFMLPYNVVQHHQSARELVKSAETCPLCELLRVACIMDSFRERGEEKAYDHSREPLSQILGSVNRGKGSALFDRINNQIAQSDEPIFLMLWNQSNPRQRYSTGGYKLDYIRLLWKRLPEEVLQIERKTVFTRLQVFNSKDNSTPYPKLTPYVSSREPLYDSGSTQALDLIREWVNRCQKDHPNCVKAISGENMNTSDLHQLPTRLVDLGPLESNLEPRLVNTKGYPEGQWVALSHCWGKPENHPPKTTRYNFEQRLNQIPLSLMPKTFLDAMAVTKALGVQYIWIDSLCIIQDDEEDWLAESKLMGSVYEKAFFTIAASSAPDSRGGLFIPRPYGDLKVPTVSIPFEDPVTNASEHFDKYSIGLEWRQEPFMQELDPMDTALSKRGWATQEWILSRRTIHFLDRGLVWVCKTTAEAETGYFVVGRGIPIQEYSNAWGQIVQEHSARLFTYQRDRLVSLEGLASKFRHFKPKDDWYAAGIWGSDMPLHLLWSPKMLAWDRDGRPSWSWVSCPSEIWFRIRETATRRDCESFTSRCHVEGADMETGVLKLRARKREIEAHMLQEFDLEDGHRFIRGRANHHLGHYIKIVDTDEEPSGWAVFDDAKRGESVFKNQEDKRVFFLYLSDVTFSTAPHFEAYGLLLAKSSIEEEKHVRIGIAAFSDSALIKDESEEDIEIK